MNYCKGAAIKEFKIGKYQIDYVEYNFDAELENCFNQLVEIVKEFPNDDLYNNCSSLLWYCFPFSDNPNIVIAVCLTDIGIPTAHFHNGRWIFEKDLTPYGNACYECLSNQKAS
jgi:hypothetical protein